jgi:osmotically-inducible protein OsmY
MNTSKQVRIAAVACVVTIGWLAGCDTIKATQSASAKPDDATLSATVKTSFAQDLSLRGEPITVSASDGVVSLGGSVSSRDEKDRAEAIARSVPGVASVYDDLAVK